MIAVFVRESVSLSVTRLKYASLCKNGGTDPEEEQKLCRSRSSGTCKRTRKTRAVSYPRRDNKQRARAKMISGRLEHATKNE